MISLLGIIFFHFRRVKCGELYLPPNFDIIVVTKKVYEKPAGGAILAESEQENVQTLRTC